ncbi:sensor histidine kinase [Lacinutrix sp. Bg11-31]|uniref:sensor histidine kinase n=1 Tax=Lacinutrix sp. Bg11-31 TaxID=2057808 RepID=UPI000C306981|nr:histidine kinase [Lacinutrix sp. Bg11-31]AUC81227.1 histidine kinase [Lacinutrix sp. Bg11-31]
MLKKEFILKKLGQVLLHVLFWLGVLFFYTYFFGVGSTDFNQTLYFSLFLMPITITTTYVSIYKLIPEYLITKQYFRFGLYSLYTLIISGYLIFVSIFFSLIFLSNFEYNKMSPISKNLLFVMTGVYLVVIIVSAFKLLKLNLKNSEKANVLETKILETQLKLKEQELNYLKMQIHPHFLFNTLNTMYGFALKKADETPEMILKLSNLLDYLLYQTDKPFVSLTEEINHIKDYIALEQLRFNDTLAVSFISKNIKETTNISPMLLMPFVENSFKHGFIQNGALKVDITISCEAENLRFYIKNTSQKQTNSENGIGLENIKKRLELLYKDKYTLDINDNETTFEVVLKLNTKTLKNA